MSPPPWLQRLPQGLLFDDGTFLTWNTPFRDLREGATLLPTSSDREQLLLPRRGFMGGLDGGLTAFRWSWEPEDRRLGQLESQLGQDETGEQIYRQIRAHLEPILGVPRLSDGTPHQAPSVVWELGPVHIGISVWERFAIFHRFYLGLASLS